MLFAGPIVLMGCGAEDPDPVTGESTDEPTWNDEQSETAPSARLTKGDHGGIPMRTSTVGSLALVGVMWTLCDCGGQTSVGSEGRQKDAAVADMSAQDAPASDTPDAQERDAKEHDTAVPLDATVDGPCDLTAIVGEATCCNGQVCRGTCDDYYPPTTPFCTCLFERGGCAPNAACCHGGCFAAEYCETGHDPGDDEQVVDTGGDCAPFETGGLVSSCCAGKPCRGRCVVGPGGQPTCSCFGMIGGCTEPQYCCGLYHSCTEWECGWTEH